jgi:hypothetical protein
MDIGMPENKPAPQWLSDIYPQHGNGSRITDEAYNNSCVDNGRKFLLANDIGQESCEKRACTKGDHGEIKYDPQAKGKIVIHICLVQPFIEA